MTIIIVAYVSFGLMICRYYIAALSIGLMMITKMSYGQINVKVGYNVISPSFTEVDKLLAAYTPVRGEISKPFGSLTFMHGIGLGLRYKMGSTAIEADWSSMRSEKSALSYITASDSFDELGYNFGVRGFSLGFDQYIGALGFGSAITSTNFNVKRTVGSNKLRISSESQYHLQLRLLWKIQQSDQVSLELRPYYQFSFGDYSLDGLAADLRIPSNEAIADNPSLFGLSLVFYNGRH